MIKTYETWRNDSLHQRLVAGRLLGIAGMLFFVVLDTLAHSAEAQTLLLYRVISIALLLASGLLDRTRFGRLNAQFVLLLMVWILTLPMIHMSVVLGGFPSSYYLGVILIHCGAVAIFPLSLRVHLIAQAGTFVYYYGLTLLTFGTTDFFPYGVETVFFHLWFFGLLDVAVFYYERIARERYASNTELESSHALLLAKDQLRTNYWLTRNTEIRDALNTALHRTEDGGIQAQKDKQPAYQQMFEATRRPILRLRREMFDFLDLAELETGSMVFTLTNFNIVPLVQECIDNRKKALESHDLEVKTSFSVNNVTIRSDYKRLKQLITSLLDRLMGDATRGKIKVSVNVGATKSGESLLVMLSADGVGMAPEQRVRLFLPFFTKEEIARGIRLPIARLIARQLGGEITVSGELGHGTTFGLELPFEKLK